MRMLGVVQITDGKDVLKKMEEQGSPSGATRYVHLCLLWTGIGMLTRCCIPVRLL